METIKDKDVNDSMDPKQAAFEQDIPKDLQNDQPLETLTMLDKRFDDPNFDGLQLLAEIRLLQDSRMRDFQNIESRVDRMPALPTIRFVAFGFREVLRLTRISSYFEKYKAVRKDRIDRFQKYQDHLRQEYIDSLSRYERLTEVVEVKVRARYQQQLAREAERLVAERNGIVLGMKGMDKKSTKLMSVAQQALKLKKSNEKAYREFLEKEQKDMMAKDKRALDEVELPEDMMDPGYEPADKIVYLRHVLADTKGKRDFRMYQCRSKLLTQADRVQLLKEYRLVSSVKPGKKFAELLKDYEGINIFIDRTPQKVPKVEDFLIEFELLCAHFSIETQIHIEDGRPFAFELDGRFASKFAEQVIESTYPPYDVVESESPSGFSNNAGNGQTGGNVPGSATSERPGSSEFGPKLEQWQEAQADVIRGVKDTDFEMIFEFDLICTNELELVQTRLKETSKKIWEAATKKSTMKPMTKGGSGSKGSARRSGHENAHDYDDPRYPGSFDLGMMVPDGHIRLSDRHVLDGKKQHFGQILRAIEESRLVEQELMNVDPTRTSGLSAAEFQWIRAKERNTNDDIDPVQMSLSQSSITIASLIANMWHHTHNFNMPDPNANPSPAPGGNPGEQKLPSNFPGAAKAKLPNYEDVRTIRGGKISVTDLKGTSIVYDVALEDMKVLEKEMLKIASIYINAGLKGREALSTTYMDELRYKMADRRADVKDITFLNPSVDRTQILLEMYECEVRFQYAKIEVINAYLEIHEHASAFDDIKKTSQVITNLIHLRPQFDFDGGYFGYSYNISSKSLELQSRLLVESMNHLITTHRDWLTGYHMKLNKNVTSDVESSKMPSPVVAGLPWGGKMVEQSVIMHHAGVHVNMAEFVPQLTALTSIWDEAKKHSAELCRALEAIISPVGSIVRPSRAAVDCVVWKGLLGVWRGLKDHDFNPPARGRRLINGLDSDQWFGNPLLPDLILGDRYVPYDLQNEGNSRSVGNPVAGYTMLTDPAFKAKARDVLNRFFKLFTLRNRLLYSWVETEFWKVTFEDQFPQMGVNKAAYSGRLGELRYDVPEMVDSTVVEDEDGEEFDAADANAETVLEAEPAHSSHDSYPWRVGPLAMAELDEAQSNFDFTKFASFLCPPEPLAQIQTLERNWVMGAVEVHTLILCDIHKSVFTEKEEDRLKTTEKIKRPRSSGFKDRSPALVFDVDYRTLVTSILPKKKQMRKAMMLEYAKEHRNIMKKEIGEEEKDQEITILKNNLIDWYFSSLTEVVIEECERVELAKLMIEMKHFTLARPIGKVLFRLSKVGEKTKLEQMKGEPEKTIQVQECVFLDVNVTDNLAKMCINSLYQGLGGNEKIMKSQVDIYTKMFRNSMIYYRSTIIQKLILDILSLYMQSVRELREVDYVVNVMLQIKKDLSYQGAQADFTKVESYLIEKYQLWVIADVKLLEQDDCMEQYIQATLLNFGENHEEINRTQMDYLITGIADTAFLLRDEIVTSTVDMEFSRISQAAFDRCQISVLQAELGRLYTLQIIRQAKVYYDRLSDERSGRLFKIYDSVDIPSVSPDRAFGFRISEDDYAAKSAIVQNFVEDLYRACNAYLKDKRVSPAAAVVTKVKKDQPAAPATPTPTIIDDPKVFVCTKESLSKAVRVAVVISRTNLVKIIKLCLQLSKWQERHELENENFTVATFNRMNDLIRSGERHITAMSQDKTEMLENFSRDVRLGVAHGISDIYTELAALSVEVNDLRKTRRVEERKLRNRIIDEYDDMVSELVTENHVIRNRFNEYRTNTVHEVMGIISETKKEEFHQLAINSEMPDALRRAAEQSVKAEEEIWSMKDDIHELNMTLLKIKSMYTLKEQSLRSSYDKKLQKARAPSARSASARMRMAEGSSDRASELAEKLKKYEGIDVDKILSELSEKTMVIEQFVQKDRERAKDPTSFTGLTARASTARAPYRVRMSAGIRPARTSRSIERPSDRGSKLQINVSEMEETVKEKRDLPSNKGEEGEGEKLKASKRTAPPDNSLSSESFADIDELESMVTRMDASSQRPSTRFRNSRRSSLTMPATNSQADWESVDYHRLSFTVTERLLEPLAPPASYAPSAASTPRSGTPKSNSADELAVVALMESPKPTMTPPQRQEKAERPTTAVNSARRSLPTKNVAEASPPPSAWTSSPPPPNIEVDLKSLGERPPELRRGSAPVGEGRRVGRPHTTPSKSSLARIGVPDILRTRKDIPEREDTRPKTAPHRKMGVRK
ncbi:hypothetical protein HK101_005301 [Irineochytrium annulatum]|nr:hypothetical protein HK101_005301 [Irineochytrium annulatum]